MSKPCKKCPFRKNSPRGFTTFDEKRKGYLEPMESLLKHIDIELPQICHTSQSSKNNKLCRGFDIFIKNKKDSFESNNEFFSSTYDFISHHVTKRDELKERTNYEDDEN